MYVALMVWIPGDNVEVVKLADAAPPPTAAAGTVVNNAPLSVKVTVPPVGIVGVGLQGHNGGGPDFHGKLGSATTVAVNVTG